MLIEMRQTLFEMCLIWTQNFHLYYKNGIKCDTCGITFNMIFL